MAQEKGAAKKNDGPEEDKAASEADEGTDATVGEDGEIELKTGRFGGKKKKLIIIGAVAGVLLLGGGAGLYFSGVFSSKKAEPAAETGQRQVRENKDGKFYFYDLGDLMVNLSGEGKRPSFLKLKISIELDDEKDKAMMEQIKPRILDNFQVYLRELRMEDLKGSAGIYRLREELLLRVTEAAHPARVRDILITEMLVQ
ncbi:MAG: flagellar basal body-associated FliL family protein [Alphaproteobacteria bacterium]